MKLLSAATTLAFLFVKVQSHAYLNYPASRNIQIMSKLDNADPTKWWCPACGQGSGGSPGICGDPFQNAAGNPNYIPFADRFFGYTQLGQGQELDVEISVSTNHGGRMWLSVCPLSKDQATQDCFNDMNHRLRRVDSNPEYNNKVYWYLNPGNSVSAVAKYKLPADISCDDGCLMQWWWQGYQTCASPCEDASIDVPSECGTNLLNPTVPMCEPGQMQETFANCADVIIKSNGAPVRNTAVEIVATTVIPQNKVNNNGVAQAQPKSSPKPKRSPKMQSAKPHNTQGSGASTSDGPQTHTCDSSQSWCRQCTGTASTSKAGKGHEGFCTACGQATGSNKCLDCMKVSRNGGVVDGCLDCVTSSPNLAWACTTTCAAKARNVQQMQMCRQCIKMPNVEHKYCRTCMSKSKGKTARVTACTACLISGRDPHACTGCLAKGSQREIDDCFSCVNSCNDRTKCGVYLPVIEIGSDETNTTC